MGRDICGHPHGNATGPVGQQVGKRGRKHDRLGQGAIVIVPEINRILGQTFQQRLRHGGHPRLGIAAGGGVIPVDVSEVALPVDQRVAYGKILRQAGHRVIDRRVTMGVIVAHHVATDLGGFAEPARRTQPQLPHRVKNAPMHRLQTVTRIRQGPVHDRAERIGQVPLTNRTAQRLSHFLGLYVGVVEQITHR